jgi:hypothetical protein
MNERDPRGKLLKHEDTDTTKENTLRSYYKEKMNQTT